MAGRVVGAGGSIERWLSGLAGPDLQEGPLPGQTSAPNSANGEGEVKCPVCDKPRTDYGEDRARYDEDYDYYWGDIRMPLWIALILQVPWRQRLDIFVIGFIVGLIIAGIAVLWGLVLAQY